MSMKKTRLDNMLVLRGLVPTLEKARALILAKAVRVDNCLLYTSDAADE